MVSVSLATISSFSITADHANATHSGMPIRHSPFPCTVTHLELRCPSSTTGLSSDSRQQINEKAKNPESEHEGNDPFQYGTNLCPLGKGADSESYRQCDFNQDEREFDPEGDAQDTVLALVYTHPLVLGAEEDGADEVAGDEEEEEDVVEARVA